MSNDIRKYMNLMESFQLDESQKTINIKSIEHNEGGYFLVSFQDKVDAEVYMMMCDAYGDEAIRIKRQASKIVPAGTLREFANEEFENYDDLDFAEAVKEVIEPYEEYFDNDDDADEEVEDANKYKASPKYGTPEFDQLVDQVIEMCLAEFKKMEKHFSLEWLTEHPTNVGNLLNVSTHGIALALYHKGYDPEFSSNMQNYIRNTTSNGNKKLIKTLWSNWSLASKLPELKDEFVKFDVVPRNRDFKFN